MATFKELCSAGILAINTHGSPTNTDIIYLNSESNVINWIDGEVGISAEVSAVVPNAWAAVVGTNWYANNWKEELDARKSIVYWMACHNGEGVAQGSGGRSALGYVGTTYPLAVQNDTLGIFGRMSGRLSDGDYRSLFESYVYGGWNNATPPTTLLTFGNEWTTLCPSPVAVFPTNSVGPRKGWGCILFDTYMNNTVLASDALTKTAGACLISNVRWLDNGFGKYGIGFDFDNTTANGATIRADAYECQNKAPSPYNGDNLGRELNGDRIQGNGDDKTWIFY